MMWEWIAVGAIIVVVAGAAIFLPGNWNDRGGDG